MQSRRTCHPVDLRQQQSKLRSKVLTHVCLKKLHQSFLTPIFARHFACNLLLHWWHLANGLQFFRQTLLTLFHVADVVAFSYFSTPTDYFSAVNRDLISEKPPIAFGLLFVFINEFYQSTLIFSRMITFMGLRS
jgi:hypothetical protein